MREWEKDKEGKKLKQSPSLILFLQRALERKLHLRAVLSSGGKELDFDPPALLTHWLSISAFLPV